MKQLVRRYTRASRQALHDHSPGWLRRTFGPAASYFDLMIMDHGIARLFYSNKHKLGRKAWRSAQPAPHDIARLRRLDIKTIINLRGERLSGGYWLEVAACKRHGIKMENCTLRSRAAPSVSELQAVRDLLARIEYPVLIHCKSGADRAGLMSVLYMHLVEEQPIEQALDQLSLKFGHIKQADTGVLDHFFHQYLEANQREPIAFYDWVENVYNPKEVLKTFRANTMLSRIMKDVFRRE
jgi:protein tyrosine/serine phosphatase